MIRISGGDTVVYSLSSGENCRYDAHNQVGDDLEKAKEASDDNKDYLYMLYVIVLRMPKKSNQLKEYSHMICYTIFYKIFASIKLANS